MLTITKTTSTFVREGVAVDEAVAVADAVNDGETKSPVIAGDHDAVCEDVCEVSALDEDEADAVDESDARGECEKSAEAVEVLVTIPERVLEGVVVDDTLRLAVPVAVAELVLVAVSLAVADEVPDVDTEAVALGELLSVLT